MADFLSVLERSELMASVRGANTKPERLLLAALRKLGLKPQKNAADLPGKPDFVFRQRRLACFVDGEFWHGVQWRRRGLKYLDEQFAGGTKPEYWRRKVHRNIERDLRSTSELLRAGWSVIRFWASDVERDAAACAAQIARIKSGEEQPSQFSGVGLGTSADFFAGIGLMRMGLERAGWKTVWANDRDPIKCQLYRHNLNDDALTLDERSIELVEPKDLPRVGLVSACFPCTDLSLAGEGRGLEKGPQSSAYLRFADILAKLKRKRPPFVILENVIGLIHSHAGKDFRTCLQRLADAGYKIDAIKIDAAHFVPQSRPRMFVVGVRDDLDMYPPTFAVGEYDDVTGLRPTKLKEFMSENSDLPWAIRPLPPLPERSQSLADIVEPYEPNDDVWWSAERVQRLQEQVSPRHQAMLDELVARDGVVLATAFRRMRNGRSMAELRFDGVAGCLRTPKGGSAKQILIRADRKRWLVRLLTPKECGRLMGATGFRIDAAGISTDDVLFGFGDAVCVPAVEWLVRNYINPIAAELLRGKLLQG